MAMVRIGVISDTHGLLRPEVAGRLEGCSCIVHAGDFGRESVLEALEDIAPVYGVRGNNDWGWGERLPRQLAFEAGGVRFLMTHDRAHLPGSWGRPRWWYSVTPTDTTRRISWGGCGSTPAAADGPGSGRS